MTHFPFQAVATFGRGWGKRVESHMFLTFLAAQHECRRMIADGARTAVILKEAGQTDGINHGRYFLEFIAK